MARLAAVVIWAVLTGAVFYTVGWSSDVPLRHVVVAHVIVVSIASISTLVIGEKGFETLVLVVIATTMAVIALPAYHDYSVRRSVSEAVAYGQAVAQALDRSKQRKSLDQLGVALPPAASKAAVESDGSVTVTLADQPLAGKQILFVPVASKGGHTWRCKPRDKIKPAYLPRACRDD